ncbi:MAG: 3-isopropylmalate dehydratase small subunit [Spirochaetes bacterium]|jgi:3-isopropylmalate/(R)-2-methylmalate dehydratase small subunit|nr:3-isopropylmalate dehydratase small subunit [Spirochaetota bacterium]
MKQFKGKVLFLDRGDINTDEIIPAKYLTEATKEALKPYLLEDLKMPGFEHGDIKGKGVIITRKNFGCGSSREHAPWALEVNGINAVIAPSFARIFRQNMYNCGLAAIELPEDVIGRLFAKFEKKDTECAIDIDSGEIIVYSGAGKEKIKFSISGFDKALVLSGGWVGYADARY